jgi:hypothetical protein
MAKDALMLKPSIPKSNGVTLRPCATSALPVKMVPPVALEVAVALAGEVKAIVAPELDEKDALDRCPGVVPNKNDVSQSTQNDTQHRQKREDTEDLPRAPGDVSSSKSSPS